MNNKIFLDSSILVEYRKGAQTDLLESIVSNTTFQPFINQVVVSEYLFYHIAIFSGKSPMSVKSAGNIAQYLSMGDPNAFLAQFSWLQDFPYIFRDASKLMSSYNLLPNDSLILSTCLFHKIPYLASFDTDYALSCQSEGITLISNKADFERIRP